MQIDPRMLKKAMEQMGIKTSEIDAKRVIIEKENEEIIIDNPKVVSIEAKGESSFQISGEIRIEKKISEEDVKLVMEKTNVKEEDARKALEETNGDIAEAIMRLSK